MHMIGKNAESEQLRALNFLRQEKIVDDDVGITSERAPGFTILGIRRDEEYPMLNRVILGHTHTVMRRHFRHRRLLLDF